MIAIAAIANQALRTKFSIPVRIIRPNVVIRRPMTLFLRTAQAVVVAGIRPVTGDLAVADSDHPTLQFVNNLLVVRRQEHGSAIFVDLLQHPDNVPSMPGTLSG